MRGWRDSDLWHSFTRSQITVAAAAIAGVMILAAFLAPLIAPHNPFDLASLDLLDAHIPPVWSEDGETRFLIGTDDQGRDLLSAILYGARISIGVGIASVILSLVLGVGLGLSSPAMRAGASTPSSCGLPTSSSVSPPSSSRSW